MAVTVELKRGESAEKMIRRFVRTVRTDGILREYLQKQSFEKKSQKARKKHSRAVALSKK